MFKLCSKCEISKDLDQFPKDKTKKSGYCSCCKECKKKYWDINRDKFNERKRIDYSIDKEKYKRYASENQEKIKQYQKQYRINNFESLRMKEKDRYMSNREEYKHRMKEYASKSKDKRNKRDKERRDSDLLVGLSIRIRSLISNSIKRNGYIKESSTSEILGCSFEEFKNYIESKFETWMRWDNRGLYNGELNYGWDLDHIVPVSSGKSKQEIIILNHYSNFQPLCSKINRDIKRDKL